MVKYSKTINGEFIDLGEEQFDYDKALNIDETLDSCKIIIDNNIRKEFDPGIFILLDNEYWYLMSDKTTTETDYISTHVLELIELTQILNDIFIQDCTFYQNRYTYQEGLNRLFRMNGLYDKRIGFDINDSTINYDAIMPFFRFEGYSLFNALREIYQSLDRFPRVVRSDDGYLIVKFDTLDGLNKPTYNLNDYNDYNFVITKNKSWESNSNCVISDVYNVGGNNIISYPSTQIGTHLVPNNYDSKQAFSFANLES